MRWKSASFFLLKRSFHWSKRFCSIYNICRENWRKIGVRIRRNSYFTLLLLFSPRASSLVLVDLTFTFTSYVSSSAFLFNNIGYKWFLVNINRKRKGGTNLTFPPPPGLLLSWVIDLINLIYVLGCFPGGGLLGTLCLILGFLYSERCGGMGSCFASQLFPKSLNLASCKIVGRPFVDC